MADIYDHYARSLLRTMGVNGTPDPEEASMEEVRRGTDALFDVVDAWFDGHPPPVSHYEAKDRFGVDVPRDADKIVPQTLDGMPVGEVNPIFRAISEAAEEAEEEGRKSDATSEPSDAPADYNPYRPYILDHPPQPVEMEPPSLLRLATQPILNRAKSIWNTISGRARRLRADAERLVRDETAYRLANGLYDPAQDIAIARKGDKYYVDSGRLRSAVIKDIEENRPLMNPELSGRREDILRRWDSYRVKEDVPLTLTEEVAQGLGKAADFLLPIIATQGVGAAAAGSRVPAVAIAGKALQTAPGAAAAYTGTESLVEGDDLVSAATAAGLSAAEMAVFSIMGRLAKGRPLPDRILFGAGEVAADYGINRLQGATPSQAAAEAIGVEAFFRMPEVIRGISSLRRRAMNGEVPLTEGDFETLARAIEAIERRSEPQDAEATVSDAEPQAAAHEAKQADEPPELTGVSPEALAAGADRETVQTDEPPKELTLENQNAEVRPEEEVQEVRESPLQVREVVTEDVQPSPPERITAEAATQSEKRTEDLDESQSVGPDPVVQGDAERTVRRAVRSVPSLARLLDERDAPENQTVQSAIRDFSKAYRVLDQDDPDFARVISAIDDTFRRGATHYKVDDATDVYVYPGGDPKIVDAIRKIRAMPSARKRSTPKAPPRPTPRTTAEAKTDTQRIASLRTAMGDDSGKWGALDHIHVGPNIAVATDGRRMHVLRGEFQSVIEPGLYRIEGTAEKPSLKANADPDAKYIEYQKFSDNVQPPKVVGINLEQLLDSVLKARIVAGEGSVSLYRNPDGTLGVAAYSPDIGAAAVRVQDAAELIGGLNPDYMVDAIRFLQRNGYGEAGLHYESPSRPFLFLAGEADSAGLYPAQAIIMPLQSEPGSMPKTARGESFPVAPKAGKTKSRKTPGRGAEAQADVGDTTGPPPVDETSAAAGPSFSAKGSRKAPGRGAEAQADAGDETGPPRVDEDDTVRARPVPVPELVEMATELLSDPSRLRVNPQLSEGTLGVFRHGDGKIGIEISPSAASSPERLASVLAHEIGHLIDYLPDKTLARGNILGRIASLRRHMGRYLAATPTSPGPLSKQDIERLRAEAESMAAGGEKWIDEVIRRETPITPKDVLNVWNSVEITNPDLDAYIARLSSAQKKAIIAQAMRGIVADDLKRFAKVVEERTGRRVRVKEAPDIMAVEARLKELIEEEIKKRRLLSHDVIRAELMGLSRWWRPYDPGSVGASYRRYRSRSRELYADAISVLLNAPGEALRRAPEFVRGFQAYIEKKPEVLRSYVEALKRLNGSPEELAATWLDRVQNMFTTSNEQWRAAAAEEAGSKGSVFTSVVNWLAQYAWSSASPAMLHARKKPSSRQAVAAKYALDEYFIRDALGRTMVMQTQREVYAPLADAGVTDADIGAYLFARRITNDRGELVNPGGFTAREADPLLQALKSRIGDERFSLLEEKVKTWHNILYDLSRDAVESGVYSRRAFDEIITPNKDSYAAFVVAHHLLDSKSTRIPAKIMEQVGSFSPILNPFHGTMQKFFTLTRHIEANRAKMAARDVLLADFPDEIKKMKLAPGQSEPRRPPRKGYDWLHMMEDGKHVVYEVPREWARIFSHHDIGGLHRMASIIRSKTYRIFHALYVKYSPGFVAANPFIDARRTYVNVSALIHAHKRPKSVQSIFPVEVIRAMPGAVRTAGKILAEYWRSKSPAARKALGIHDEIIEQMEREKAFNASFIDLSFADALAADPYQALLKRAGLHTTEKQRGAVITALKGILDAIQAVGVATEAASKISGYRVLKAQGLEPRELAYAVRNHVGTGNYMRRGLATPVYDTLYMYANVRLQMLLSDVDLATHPETRAGWWAARTVTTVIPSMLSYAAIHGIFGDEIQKIMLSIDEYTRTNYDVIPLGFTVRGKPVYLTIPQDSMGRVFSQAIHTMLDVIRAAGDSDIDVMRELDRMFSSVSGDLMPTENPVINIVSKWVNYVRGINPIDEFRGRPILDPRAANVRGVEGVKRMMWWTADQFGVLSTLADPLMGDPRYGAERRTVGEVVMSYTGIGRLIRVSDRGITEAEIRDHEMQDIRRDRLRLSLPDEVDGALKKWYRLKSRKPEGLSARDAAEREMMIEWYQEYYLPYLRAIRELEESGRSADGVREALRSSAIPVLGDAGR